MTGRGISFAIPAVLALAWVAAEAGPLASLADTEANPAPAPITYVFDASSTDVRFFYRTPLSKGHGRFSGVTGTAIIDDSRPEATFVEASVPTASLQAGSTLAMRALRGPHFFSITHHPHINFRGTDLRVTGQTTAQMSGQITVRGITRSVLLDVHLAEPKPSGARTLRASTHIHRSDFEMTAYPKLIGEAVEIEITARLLPR